MRAALFLIFRLTTIVWLDVDIAQLAHDTQITILAMGLHRRPMAFNVLIRTLH